MAAGQLVLPRLQEKLCKIIKTEFSTKLRKVGNMATEFSRVTYKLTSLSLNENNFFLPAKQCFGQLC